MHEFIRTKEEGELVEEALANPIGTKRLSELAVGKKRVTLVTSDHTRAVPSKLTLPILLREIRKGESGGGDYDPHRDRTAPRAYGRGAAPESGGGTPEGGGAQDGRTAAGGRAAHGCYAREFSIFFGWASAVYALFYTSACIKCIGDHLPFFRRRNPYLIFGLCTRRSGVPLKKDSTFTVVSMLLLGVSVFLTDNLSIQLITKTGHFSSRHQPDASSVFR